MSVVRASAQIPQSLTCRHPWDEVTAEDTWQCGYPLSPRAVAYLDTALAGLSRAEKLEQMADINWPVYETWTLHQKGRSVRDIAIAESLSERAIRDRLARARAFLGEETPADAFDALDQQVRSVYVLSRYGWHQGAIAALFDISVSTVKRAVARAREALGDADRDPATWCRLRKTAIPVERVTR